SPAGAPGRDATRAILREERPMPPTSVSPGSYEPVRKLKKERRAPRSYGRRGESSDRFGCWPNIPPLTWLRRPGRALRNGSRAARGRCSDRVGTGLREKLQRRHRMRLKLVIPACAALAMTAFGASAHHSFTATYDESKEITIEGELVQFS